MNWKTLQNAKSIHSFLAFIFCPTLCGLLQLYELDPTVGQHIEYTFGDGVQNIPTSLYVMEKVQAEVFYHLSPTEVNKHLSC
jgi:hypothetical protein